MSLSFLEDNRVEVVTGVNLPMVIKFVSDRGKFPVAELAERLKVSGRESILVAGAYLKK
jgi:PTS system mannose-specific IIA component